MIDFLLSYPVFSIGVPLLLLGGQGAISLADADNYKIAKACFIGAGLYVAAKFVQLGFRHGGWDTYPLFALAVAVCFLFCLEASRYVDRKRSAKLNTEVARLDITCQSKVAPFLMDHAGGRLYRIGVTSSANAIVRVMVEKAILDGQTVPNLSLRITGDSTALETEKELHEGVPAYWDVVEKFSHGGGIQLRHVMQGLPHDLGTKSTFKIIASSNKRPTSAKWGHAKIDKDDQLQFQLSDHEAARAFDEVTTPRFSFELVGLNSERYNDGVQYMLPRFKYTTGIGHPPKVEIKANLKIFDDSSRRMHEFSGVWHRSKVRSKKFSAGDSGDLVLGLIRNEGMVAYEYNVLRTVNGTELSPKVTELDGTRFYVLVVFIARTDRDILLFEKRQWFGINAGPEPKFIGLLKQPSHLV